MNSLNRFLIIIIHYVRMNIHLYVYNFSDNRQFVRN